MNEREQLLIEQVAAACVIVCLLAATGAVVLVAFALASWVLKAVF